MTKTHFFVAVLIAVIGLVSSNQGFSRTNCQGDCEISSQEYAKLQDAIDFYPEIAAAAREDLTQEFVTASEYKKIMRQVDVVKLKRTRQMTAMRDQAR